MALNLLMLGPPGAGKGTQAERFGRARGIPKISTGDILREAVHANTDIGLRAKAIMDRGELVGDEVMIGIVREQITERGIGNGMSLIIYAGIVVGLPRAVLQTIEQMRTGQLGLLRILFLIVFMALVIAAIVFVERAHRRVTVQYAKRVEIGRAHV